jgi:hypothetical protein
VVGLTDASERPPGTSDSVLAPKMDEAVAATAAGDLSTVLEIYAREGVITGGLPEKLFGQLASTALRDRLRRERAARGWREPTAADHGLLPDLFTRPVPAIPFLVDSLQGRNHNVGLTGQYKVGKTTLLCTYVKVLVDGEPFLLRPTHLPDGQRVAWLNFEMDTDDLLDYLRPLRIEHPDQVALLNLRGLRLPLLTDPAYDWLKKWLIEKKAGALVIDSWRRLCSSCGLNENQPAEVEELTQRLDQLKKEAGVPALLVTAHTPRERLPEGEERARGATAFDDWVDVRWVQTRSNGARFLAAQGRGVPERERALVFDETTRRVTVGGGDRGQRRREEGVEHVVNIVTAHHLTGGADGLSKNELKNRLRDADGISHNDHDLNGYIRDAVAAGRVHYIEGPNRAHRYRPGTAPTSSSAGAETAEISPSETSETK